MLQVQPKRRGGEGEREERGEKEKERETKKMTSREKRENSIFFFVCLFWFFFVCFLGLHLRHMEVPRLGV